MSRAIKVDHAGAKNGGGFYGRRVEAKTISRSLRRRAEPRIIAEQLDDVWDLPDPVDYGEVFCETCRGPCTGD